MKKIKTLILTFLIISNSCSKDDDIEILAPSIVIETTNENVETTYTSIKIKAYVLIKYDFIMIINHIMLYDIFYI